MAEAMKKVPLSPVAHNIHAILKTARVAGCACYYVEVRNSWMDMDHSMNIDVMVIPCHDEYSARTLFAVLGNSTHAHLTDETI